MERNRDGDSVQAQGRGEAGLTERSIQLGIMRDLHGRIVCACPNYTPSGWWECDLWAVTKAGYAVEYEIKLSIADFRADAKKGRTHWAGYDREQRKPIIEQHNKHQLIGSEKGPTRFFYAVPESLVDAVLPELPEWAGLVRAKKWGGIPLAHPVRDAPRLHSTKVNRREIQMAQRRMWFRYWESLRTIERMAHDAKHLGRQRATIAEAP